MVTASKCGPQDLPPAGGYSPIQTERIPLRRIVGWKTGLAFAAVIHTFGAFSYRRGSRSDRRDKVEMRSAQFALQPVLQAERDRAFLKQIRKNRDEEADLMKDYPGWVVGTYFGEPVYHDLPEDSFVEPTFREYTVHAPVGGSKTIRSVQRHLT